MFNTYLSLYFFFLILHSTPPKKNVARTQEYVPAHNKTPCREINPRVRAHPFSSIESIAVNSSASCTAAKKVGLHQHPAASTSYSAGLRLETQPCRLEPCLLADWLAPCFVFGFDPFFGLCTPIPFKVFLWLLGPEVEFSKRGYDSDPYLGGRGRLPKKKPLLFGDPTCSPFPPSLFSPTCLELSFNVVALLFIIEQPHIRSACACQHSLL